MRLVRRESRDRAYFKWEMAAVGGNASLIKIGRRTDYSLVKWNINSLFK